MKARNNTMDLIQRIEYDINTACVEVEAEKLDGSNARKAALVEWGNAAVNAACYGNNIPDYANIGKRFTKAQNAFINAVVSTTVSIEDTKSDYANVSDIGYHALSVFVDFWMNCRDTDAKFAAYYAVLYAAKAGLSGAQISETVQSQTAPHNHNMSNADRQQLEALHAALCEMDEADELALTFDDFKKRFPGSYDTNGDFDGSLYVSHAHVITFSDKFGLTYFNVSLQDTPCVPDMPDLLEYESMGYWTNGDKAVSDSEIGTDTNQPETAVEGVSLSDEEKPRPTIALAIVKVQVRHVCENLITHYLPEETKPGYETALESWTRALFSAFERDCFESNHYYNLVSRNYDMPDGYTCNNPAYSVYVNHVSRCYRDMLDSYFSAETYVYEDVNPAVYEGWLMCRNSSTEENRAVSNMFFNLLTGDFVSCGYLTQQSCNRLIMDCEHANSAAALALAHALYNYAYGQIIPAVDPRMCGNGFKLATAHTYWNIDRRYRRFSVYDAESYMPTAENPVYEIKAELGKLLYLARLAYSSNTAVHFAAVDGLQELVYQYGDGYGIGCVALKIFGEWSRYVTNFEEYSRISFTMEEYTAYWDILLTDCPYKGVYNALVECMSLSTYNTCVGAFETLARKMADYSSCIEERREMFLNQFERLFYSKYPGIAVWDPVEWSNTVTVEDVPSDDGAVYSKREILYNMFLYQFSQVYAALGVGAFTLTGFRVFSQFAASLWEVVETGVKPEILVSIPDPVGEHMADIWRDIRTAYKYTIERMTDITDDAISSTVMVAENRSVLEVIDSNVMEADEKASTINSIIQALTADYPAYSIVNIHEHLSDKYQQGDIDFVLESLDRLRDVIIADGGGTTPPSGPADGAQDSIPETAMDILPELENHYTTDSPNVLYKELILNQFYSSYSYISRGYEMTCDAMEKGILAGLWYRLCTVMNNSFSSDNPAEWELTGNSILDELEIRLSSNADVKTFARACVLDWMYYGMLSLKVSGVVSSAIMEAAQAVQTAICGGEYAPETSAAIVSDIWECVIRDGYEQKQMKENIERVLQPYGKAEKDHIKAILVRLYNAILPGSNPDGITYGELYNTAVGGAFYWKQQAIEASADDEERAYIESMWQEAVTCYNSAPLVGADNAAHVLAGMNAAVNTCGMARFHKVPMLLLSEGLERVAHYAVRRVVNGCDIVPEPILKAAQEAQEAAMSAGLSPANASTVAGYVWRMATNDVEKLTYYTTCIDNVTSTYSKTAIKQIKKAVQRLETVLKQHIPSDGDGNNPPRNHGGGGNPSTVKGG